MSAPGPVRFVSEFQLAAAKGQRISRVRQQALPIDIPCSTLLLRIYANINDSMQEVLGRTVTVLLHGGNIYALDSACFHMGGPVGEAGDIEELAGSACIVCPWHGRKVHFYHDFKIYTA